MNVLALTIAALTLVTAPEKESVTIRVVAAEARSAGLGIKQFAQGTEEIKSAVGGLKFDSYNLIKSGTVQAPFKKETRFDINTKYALFITPQSKEDGGRIKIEVRMTMSDADPNKKPVNVLTTTVTAAPGKELVLHGPKLEKGELVVTLTVK